jgi:hypothetical protein
LRDGVEQTIRATRAIEGLRVLGFVTNSTRHLEVEADDEGRQIFYHSTAGKPFLIGPYRDLPGPAVWAGDQIATDGLLAWRLGFAFAHVHVDSRPWAPTLMHHLGRPLAPYLFHPDERDHPDAL